MGTQSFTWYAKREKPTETSNIAHLRRLLFGGYDTSAIPCLFPGEHRRQVKSVESLSYTHECTTVNAPCVYMARR